jgi:hypothetical protein
MKMAAPKWKSEDFLSHGHEMNGLAGGSGGVVNGDAKDSAHQALLKKNFSNVTLLNTNDAAHAFKFTQSRNSIVSRQSIELFLDQFPKNEFDYTNREFFLTMRDIVSGDLGLHEGMTWNEKVQAVIQSHKYHLFFVLLVIFDCICVVVQMVLDIVHKEEDKYNNKAPYHTHGPDDYIYLGEEIAEGISIFILSLFIISILLHAIFIPKMYFKSKLEMFDALIVIISLCLEVVSVVKKDEVKEIEAGVITFRLVHFFVVALFIISSLLLA